MGKIQLFLSRNQTQGNRNYQRQNQRQGNNRNYNRDNRNRKGGYNRNRRGDPTRPSKPKKPFMNEDDFPALG